MGYDFGRSRDPAKVKKLSPKLKKQMEALDAECQASFDRYLSAITALSAFHRENDLVKVRVHSNTEKPKPKPRGRK